MPDGLTPRQRKFCELYVQSGNAAEASRSAGYSSRSARQIGEKLTKDDNCREYIHELQEQLASERILSVSRIKAFWSDTVQDPQQRMTDRLQASNLLARSSGMFVNRSEVSADIRADDRSTLIVLPAIPGENGEWQDPPCRSATMVVYDPDNPEDIWLEEEG